jgi:PAS domain S-box-containing protein
MARDPLPPGSRLAISTEALHKRRGGRVRHSIARVGNGEDTAGRDHSAALVGAAVVVVVALGDVLLMESAVLVPLLILGPLLTAVRGDARTTVLVALLAFLVALLLGLADDNFLATDHLIEISAVAGGGLLAAAAGRARERFERAVGVAEELLRRERLARRRSEVLASAGRLLEAPPDPAEMLQRVVELAVPDLAALCIADLLTPEGRLQGAATHAADPAAADALRDLRDRFPLDPDGPHPSVVAARTGRPALVPALTTEQLRSFAASPEHLELMLNLSYSSALVAPLIARGRTLGVLSFLRFAGEPAYDEGDLEIAGEIARRAALALDNARLFADLARTEGQLEAILGNLGEAVTVQDDERMVYANQAAADLLGASTPEELLATSREELAHRFVLLDEAGEPLEPERFPGRLALAGGHPEPLLVRNVIRATGEERWLVTKATPVLDEQGAVTLSVTVFEDVTQVRRAERQQRFLSDASKLVSSSLDVAATLEKVAWAVVPELADWCRVDVVGEQGVPTQGAVAHVDERGRDLLLRLRAHHPQDEQSTIAGVMQSGEPLVFPEVDEEVMHRYSDDDEHFALLRDIGTRSAVMVPMTAGDTVLGVITIATAASERRLGEEELGILQELGRRAGIAVENARVYAARSHIAMTLQRSLLPPRLPAVPGMTIAARFRAAGEGSEVGGDFYDLFPVEGGWMVIIGDVTGKGPEAAAITSLARYTMRTAAMYEQSPAAVLDRLNRALEGDPDRRRLCTAICARVEPDGDLPGGIRVTLACGGHPPPFLVSPGRPPRPLGASGPLLGAFSGGDWSQDHLTMRPREAIVLYTDGVTDTRGSHERFGQDRLAAVLEETAGRDADEIAGRVDDALRAFQEGPQRDDVALLVLRATSER